MFSCGKCVYGVFRIVFLQEHKLAWKKMHKHRQKCFCSCSCWLLPLFDPFVLKWQYSVPMLDLAFCSLIFISVCLAAYVETGTFLFLNTAFYTSFVERNAGLSSRWCGCTFERNSKNRLHLKALQSDDWKNNIETVLWCLLRNCKTNEILELLFELAVNL